METLLKPYHFALSSLLLCGGECRKDYITLAVNQRALWGVITPAVHVTVLECLFKTCHPLF
jgi:hypothetical protein